MSRDSSTFDIKYKVKIPKLPLVKDKTPDSTVIDRSSSFTLFSKFSTYSYNNRLLLKAKIVSLDTKESKDSISISCTNCYNNEATVSIFVDDKKWKTITFYFLLSF